MFPFHILFGQNFQIITTTKSDNRFPYLDSDVSKSNLAVVLIN